MIGLFLISCIGSNVPLEKQCSLDSDCVAASCCHANESVNKANAPKCGSIFCSMECVPRTLDCSQGKVKCVEKECKVVLN